MIWTIWVTCIPMNKKMIAFPMAYHWQATLSFLKPKRRWEGVVPILNIFKTPKLYKKRHTKDP